MGLFDFLKYGNPTVIAPPAADKKAQRRTDGKRFAHASAVIARDGPYRENVVLPDGTVCPNAFNRWTRIR